MSCDHTYRGTFGIRLEEHNIEVETRPSAPDDLPVNKKRNPSTAEHTLAITDHANSCISIRRAKVIGRESNVRWSVEAVRIRITTPTTNLNLATFVQDAVHAEQKAN